MVEVSSKQHLDPLLMKLMKSVLNKFSESFSIEDGVLRYRVRLCVPDVDDLRGNIYKEDSSGFHKNVF